MTVNFSTNPLVAIGNIVSIGDYLYFSEPAYTTVKFAGQITNIEVNLGSGINRLFVNTNLTSAQPLSVADPYMFT